MKINIDFDSYLELEKIGIGAFKPLEGFMNEKDFYSVAESMRLVNGKLFPIPILLPIPKIESEHILKKKKILLIYDNNTVGEIYPESVFSLNFKKFLHLLFGTNDEKHPGYKILNKSGRFFLGGRIKLLKQIKYKNSEYSITPKELKLLIKKKKLRTVAGFQTRNVPHKAHEYILIDALKKVDGLFVQPLIGKKKVGDFLPGCILKSYKYLIDNIFPKNQVLLGTLTTSMRYSGPREAVFHAIIRKNYGCTHFLVGRDHAGVGSYYGEYDAQDLCVKFEKEIGINIIKVRGPFYCEFCKKITNDKNCLRSSQKVEVSGTKIRQALINNKEISEKFMRKEILNLIRKEDIFIK